MKGIKQEYSAKSFSKSTLQGVIRKGFISMEDIDKTSLTEYSKARIKEVIDWQEKEEKHNIDLLFIRDKQVCFLIDSKDKIVFNCIDCTLQGYYNYFINKNNDYKVQDLPNMHPDNLRARGLSVEKIASDKGFTL